MREVHPRHACKCRKNRKNRRNPFGTVHVKESGLIMKLRSMIPRFIAEQLRSRCFPFILFRSFYFPFDQRRGFL
jgi:hypothetical protein